MRLSQRTSALLAGLGMALAAAIWAAPADAAAFSCRNGQDFRLQSNYTGSMVVPMSSSSGAPDGMLAALMDYSTNTGRFDCYQANGIVSFRNLSSNLWVSAELGWTGSAYGTLRARKAISGTSNLGPWEKFSVTSISGNGSATEVVSIKLPANGRYVTGIVSEIWTPLRASYATSAGAWEKFIVRWI